MTKISDIPTANRELLDGEEFELYQFLMNAEQHTIKLPNGYTSPRKIIKPAPQVTTHYFIINETPIYTHD